MLKLSTGTNEIHCGESTNYFLWLIKSYLRLILLSTPMYWPIHYPNLIYDQIFAMLVIGDCGGIATILVFIVKRTG